ncbi:MAG: sulfite exporter TauE/SafE family protein [Deltaproteobacteria bacterium]
MTGLASVVAASVLGSLHCVGMCGGLIGFYASGATGQRQRPWLAHGAYHLTRLAAYATLGAVAGQLGAALDLAGRGVGLGQLGALLAAAVMLVWAVLLWPRAARQPGLVELRRARPTAPSPWRRLEARFVALARRARQQPPLARAALLGLSSALLPCGWLYAFAVLAAGTGSAGRGALLLAAFWSGTLPALLGLGLGVQRLTQRWRAQLPRLSALLLLALGAYTVIQRWPVAAPADGVVPSCHDAAL